MRRQAYILRSPSLDGLSPATRYASISSKTRGKRVLLFTFRGGTWNWPVENAATIVLLWNPWRHWSEDWKRRGRDDCPTCHSFGFHRCDRLSTPGSGLESTRQPVSLSTTTCAKSEFLEDNLWLPARVLWYTSSWHLMDTFRFFNAEH